MDRFESLLRERGLEDRSVIDIGCGPGVDVALMRRRGLRTVGLDLSQGMLDLAQREYPGQFILADMRSLPLANSVGGIWSCASLLHLPRSDMLGALTEFCRAMISGGILYLSVKMGDGHLWSSANDAYSSPRLYTLWQPPALDEVLASSGFRIIERITETTDQGTTWLSRFAAKDQP
jgi:ubiquinone/menaquinone biosynthesis C-methylase UbiE